MRGCLLGSAALVVVCSACSGSSNNNNSSCACDTSSACQVGCACDPDCGGHGDAVGDPGRVNGDPGGGDPVCTCDISPSCDCGCSCDPVCQSNCGCDDGLGCTTGCGCDLYCYQSTPPATSADCIQTLSSFPTTMQVTVETTDHVVNELHTQVYCVAGTAGQTLTAETRPPTSGDGTEDTVIYLLTAAGAYVASDDDGNKGCYEGFYSKLVANLPATGTFVVLVTPGITSSDSGSYTLTVNLQ